MNMNVMLGILIPFIGTTLGAGCVFFLKKEMGMQIQRVFTGFAAGVMVAASVWSLLIPAMNQSEHMGKLSFVPAAVGFMIGVVFLLLLDKIIPHLHASNNEEGIKTNWKDTTKLFFAVTLHNIPEGIAVGVVFAGLMSNNTEVTFSGALALSLGIAIQNFPEGAIMSIPLQTRGVSKRDSFFYGMASGIVEPISALITIFLAGIMVPVLPYLLSFAAGAMIYVVVEELIPEMSEGEHSNIGVMAFSVGFVLMMILDVALG